MALAAIERESVPEVDILQSIIIRENLIKELEGLLKFQSDIDSVLNEAAELVKAIRYQTLDLVEVIYAWKTKQKAQTRQFFYRGQNYLLKMMEDTAFLDNYDELGELFGFYFTGNPLMYSGVPENEMPSLLNENGENQQSLFKPSAVDRNAVLIDGLSESRIRAAENIVFREHAMINDGGKGGQHQGGGGNLYGNQQGSLAIGEGNMYESVVGDAFAGQGQGGDSSLVGQNTTQDSHSGGGRGGFSQDQDPQRQRQSSFASITSGHSSHSKPPTLNKGTKVTSLLSIKRYASLYESMFISFYVHVQLRCQLNFCIFASNATTNCPCSCSQKKNRIKKLKAEIEELQAMRCHVTDQVNTLVEEHGVFTAQHSSLERRRVDATSLENLGLAKRLAVEISIVEGELSHRASEVKSHQRQSYFLQQEMTRRKGLIKVLMAELAAMESKAGVKKKLMKIQKKEGIYAALIKVNSVVDEHVASVQSPEKEQVKELEEEHKEDDICEVLEEKELEEEVEEEPQLDASQSVFSNMEMEGLLAHGRDIEQSQDNHEMFEQEQEQHEVFEDNSAPEESLAILPVPHADRIIDDVNALANSISNFAVSSSLEMVWFVMGAAEEVRPAKIVTRNYVRDILEDATTNIACSRATADATVLECLLDGFQQATYRCVQLDFINARNKLISEFVDSACTTGLNVAVNIITHEAVAKQDRAAQRLKVFSNELATSMVRDVFSYVYTNVVVKDKLEKLEALRVEEEKKQRVVEAVANVCDEFTFSSIGAALYTIENKVMRYKQAMDLEKKQSADPNSVGVMVHPAGAGFALAKMIREQNRPVQLQMYDIDAKTGVNHTFPSISRSNADPNVNDLIHEALENTGNDYGRVMYGKELGMIHQTEVEYEDWIFDARLLQDIDQIKLVAICAIPGLERSVTFILSKEQEEDLENTRNPANFIRFILTSALRN